MPDIPTDNEEPLTVEEQEKLELTPPPVVEELDEDTFLTGDDETSPAKEPTAAEPTAEPVKEEPVEEPPAAAEPEGKPSTSSTTAEELLAELGLLPSGIGTPAAVETPPVQPAPTPTPIQQIPAAPVVQQQQVAPAVAQAQTAAYGQHRDVLVEKLANEHFALDKETVESLTEEGSEAVAKMAPKLAARIMYDTLQAVMMQVQQTVPAMIEQHTVSRTHAAKAEDAFYKFWDSRGYDLREYNGDLVSLGTAYRQTNPGANAADFIQNVGAQLILAKQLGVKKAPAKPAQAKGFTSAGRPSSVPTQVSQSGWAGVDADLFGEDI